MVAFSLSQILYRAITEVGNLAHWCTAGVRGRSKVAEQLEFWFGNFCASLVEVQQLSVNQLVQWLVTGGGATDWIDTRVEFKIVSEEARHSSTSDTQTGRQTPRPFRTARWVGRYSY